MPDAIADPPPAAQLFLLSFRQRDELAAMAERAGWSVTAARRVDLAERRFVASAAGVALVDARGAAEEGLAAARMLADPVEANAAALLVLLDEGASAADALAAGATHWLAAPFGADDLAHALRFAARHAERLSGGRREAARRRSARATEATTWRWRRGARTVALSAPFAVLIGADPAAEPALGDLLRRFGREAGKAARGAVARLLDGTATTAFAHRGPGGRRFAHHIQLTDGGTVVIGRVEPLHDAPPAVAPSPPSRDPLTGLDDRRGAFRWIAGRLAAADESPVVLLMIAASRFEMVNAAFGRGTGDALLQGVARRIERLAPHALVARIAGAEFAVGLPAAASLAEARGLADALVAAIGSPFASGGHVVTLGCRIGIAAAADGDDAAALLRRASLALAEAKAADGASVHVLDIGDEGDAARQGRLDIELRAAIERDEIELLWQPQLSLADGGIVGVEALARWRHPELGELGADILLAAAARSGFLAELSGHVQAKALHAVAGWPPALSGLRVAINVTAADVARADFAEAFLARIDRAGVARARIAVEVTESGLIRDLDAAAGLLAALRAAGVRVAIDDFGTGYSSLAYLAALPLDEIKLDRRLSQAIAGSARARFVVRGVIALARSLGLCVIAEGVETEEQRALLAAEGCDLCQGFLFAPPLDVAALERLVAGACR